MFTLNVPQNIKLVWKPRMNRIRSYYPQKQLKLKVTVENNSYFFKTNCYRQIIIDQSRSKILNDTHMEELVLYWIHHKKFIEIQGWLLLTFFICLHKKSFNSIIAQMSKNVIHQIDSKNEWLLRSVTFMAKLELVFVLTFKKAA